MVVLQAIATVNPTLKDNRCVDVLTADSLLQHCMSNHKFGLSSLLASREAARNTRDALKAAVRCGQSSPASEATASAACDGADTTAAAAEKGRPQELLPAGAWEALPVLVQRTYLLSQADYAQVRITKWLVCVRQEALIICESRRGLSC